MSEKKDNQFLTSSKLFLFIMGLIIGISTQRIDQIKAQTNPSFSNDKDTNIFENIPFGKPLSFFSMERNGYSLAYDPRNKNPHWVYETLTKDNLQGTTKRSQFNFKEDEAIPELLRATLADYKGQGFDRGHLAPAANHKSDPNAMADTFYLTNMCPQCPEFNQHYWAKLEKYVRDLTNFYKTVYVITGPLYLPQNGLDGLRYVNYRVIGPNDVAVPTHFFKILLLDNFQGQVDKLAFILPNEPIGSHIPLEQFQTTVDKVQKLAGLILSP